MPVWTDAAERIRSRLKGRRTILEWLFVGLCASVLVAWLALSGAADGPSRLIYDGLSRLQPGPPPAQVTVVAIDNRSVQAVDRWPWPRSVQAELLNSLAQTEPAAVGYDVLLLEPSPDTREDSALARAFAQIGTVYLPRIVEAPGEDGAPWRVVDPIPELADAAAGLGQVALTPDPDGAVRQAPLYLSADSQVWPHLVLGLLERTGRAPPGIEPNPAPDLLAMDPVLIAFRGPPGHVRTVSAVDLMNGETPAGLLRGQIVLVGVTADGAGDRYATPFAQDGALTPGVEIMASLIDTLITGQARSELPGGLLAAISLVPLWLLMAGFLLFRPMTNMLAGLALAGVVLVLSTTGFLEGVWASPLPAIGGLALAWPLWSWRRLEAAADYLQTEVETFEREAPPRPQQPGNGTPGDVIERLAGALQTALEDLRAAERQREQALQLLGHDMRSPQASILTLLEGDHDRSDPAFGERIADYARRTLHLAESYVQQARAEAATHNVELVDLSQIMGQAADSLWPQASARKLRLVEPDLHQETLTRADPGLLVRAFVNLMDNAIKFSPEGADILCSIEPAVEGDRPVWICSIRDHGNGIAAEALGDLSRPFHRLDAQTPGVGLGLTFVRTVADRSGGRLMCANAPGGGAVFSLILPRAEES